MSRFPSVSRDQNSEISIRRLTALLLLCSLTGHGVVCLAQHSVEEIRAALSAKAGFTADDWSALERVGIVVKLLPVQEKREVAVCGVAHLQGNPEVIMNAFRLSMVQQNREAILATGKFSNRPTLEDVQTLSLEDRDVEDLRQCVVGKCELKLSASMIGRFQKEVKWDSSDYKSQANNLFRELLLDYVRDYQTRGDAALIEYHDQRSAISLRAEQHELLNRLVHLPDVVLEFASYLKGFPNAELANVESHINWTKLKFGLKPVIIVTHIITYERLSHGERQILSISKQIYANHYFDSSLAMTAVLSIPTANGSPASYLLYTNASRSDSLAGSFSRIRRGLVQSESVKNLNALLLQTRANAEVAVANQSPLTPTSPKNPITEWLRPGSRLYVLVFALIVLGSLIFLRRRYGKRIRGRFDPSRSD